MNNSQNLSARLDEILVKHQTLTINQTAKDWKEAIHLANDLLVKAGLTTKDYAHQIIAATEEFGPYYLITDLVVMPHAKTSSANLGNGFSLVILKEPVYFGDAPAQIILCLSSTTSDFHVATALPQIAALFEDEKTTVNKLLTATSEAEVLSYIQSIDFSKYLN